MIEYINQLRARGYGSTKRPSKEPFFDLRPIMMTMLVATLGLLPAAISTGIGSDSQKPFAIVIVGGFSATLLLSIYVLRRSTPGSPAPTMYFQRLSPIWWNPNSYLPVS